jgi:hypothetical protein
VQVEMFLAGLQVYIDTNITDTEDVKHLMETVWWLWNCAQEGHYANVAVRLAIYYMYM